MCSNPCESEVTCFRPESNRGPYGLLNFLCAALSTTELWWRINHRKSFRTLLKCNSGWYSNKNLLSCFDKLSVVQFFGGSIRSSLVQEGQESKIQTRWHFTLSSKNGCQVEFVTKNVFYIFTHVYTKAQTNVTHTHTHTHTHTRSHTHALTHTLRLTYTHRMMIAYITWNYVF